MGQKQAKEADKDPPEENQTDPQGTLSALPVPETRPPVVPGD